MKEKIELSLLNQNKNFDITTNEFLKKFKKLENADETSIEEYLREEFSGLDLNALAFVNESTKIFSGLHFPEISRYFT